MATAKKRGAKPKGRARPKERMSAADRKALATAKRLSKRFHGTDGQVVELNPSERKPLPRFCVLAGDLEEFVYRPRSGKRSEYNWRHESGDRGPMKRRGTRKPMVVVDPATKRPAVVKHTSGMKFSSRGGFIG